MRQFVRSLLLSWALAPSLVSWAADLPVQPLTLEHALEEAASRSPRLRARLAVVKQAEGRLMTARTYPFNPELALEAARRTTTDGSDLDRSATISQEVEIGRQRGLRKQEASSELEAARARLLRELQILSADVRAAFTLALQAREILEVERTNTTLARSLGETARKRLDAGAAPQMEVNLAQAQVGRAEREFRLAEGAYLAARSLVAELVGLDPAQPPEISGALDVLPPISPPPLGDLVAGALQRRADLEAFRRTAMAAQARIGRIRRDVVPNLVLSAFYDREEESSRIVGGGIGVRLPLFNRNQGLIAEAKAAQQESLADVETLQLRVRLEITSALARYQAAAEAARTLQRQILGSLGENLDLLQRSFQAGKTSWTEVLVFRREFVDVQRDYVTSLTDAHLAAIELELAAGSIPSLPTVQESAP